MGAEYCASGCNKSVSTSFTNWLFNIPDLETKRDLGTSRSSPITPLFLTPAIIPECDKSCHTNCSTMDGFHANCWTEIAFAIKDCLNRTDLPDPVWKIGAFPSSSFPFSKSYRKPNSLSPPHASPAKQTKLNKTISTTVQ